MSTPSPSSPVFERDLFINNTWRPGSTGERIAVVDPAT
jgi:hypothetical protein